MRYTINKINKGEDELILNYKEKNPEVEAVLLFMDKRQRKLIGRKNDETIVFTPEEILYMIIKFKYRCHYILSNYF